MRAFTTKIDTPLQLLIDTRSPPAMCNSSSVGRTLADDLINRIETLLLDAEKNTRPLEVDPYRSQLFELFVMADAAGFLAEDADPDLSAEAIGRELASRWGLAEAVRASHESQERLPPDHLARLRLLWSFLRMWMEWTYAWQRWDEFHEHNDAP